MCDTETQADWAINCMCDTEIQADWAICCMCDTKTQALLLPMIFFVKTFLWIS